MQLEALKSSSKRNFINYDRVFEKLGSHLKQFTFDSNQDAFEVNLILKSIGKYCHNIKTMVVQLLYANTVKRLPKSLHNLTVGDFRAKCLNISALTQLEKLSLESSHTLDEIKVHRPLKEFHLQLQLGYRMPDHVRINRLTTMVSETFDVELHSDYSEPGFFTWGRTHTIVLSDLNRIMNLRLFTMDFFFATIDGINPTNIHSAKMLCSCGQYVLLSMNTLNRILNNYRGPAPATKVVRYTPWVNLTIKFEFDDDEDRYKYFERLHLGFPICHCSTVDVLVLLE